MEVRCLHSQCEILILEGCDELCIYVVILREHTKKKNIQRDVLKNTTHKSIWNPKNI
jgi:hypothetical protein